MECLGHCIRSGWLNEFDDSTATKAVKSTLFPKSSMEMKSFLSASSVYPRFIQGYATVTAPLHDMLKNESDVDRNTTIVTNDAKWRTFEGFKARLKALQVLARPNPDLPYMIDCDASNYAIDVVLLPQQKEENPKQWETVEFFSKTWNDSQ